MDMAGTVGNPTVTFDFFFTLDISTDLLRSFYVLRRLNRMRIRIRN